MDGKKIYQVVGFQNSGKTTLMEKLIKIGNGKGYRIGSIKHHGHGGVPQKKLDIKDSDIHLQAGAQIASVEGDGVIQIDSSAFSWTLDDLLFFYSRLPIDLILVEGYKKEHYPKILLIRQFSDLSLLKQLKNIKAIITWIPLEKVGGIDLYSIEDLDLFVEVFYQSIVSPE